MLGISVYFKDMDLQYLEQASKLGVEIIFNSLNIPEDNDIEIKEKLPLLIEKCRKLKLLLVSDVSPRTFEKLGLRQNDMEGLRRYGFNAVRLDFGFDDPERIVKLQQDFIIILNASVVNKFYLEKCEEAGVNLKDVILTHNFYPHKDTGLEEAYFIEKNRDFFNMNLRVQAFVCGDDLKRYPLYEGLPTLEKHRGINPYVAAVELIKKYALSEIIIGDSKAKLETLSYINDYMKNKVITLKASLESGYEYLYNQEIEVRKDIGKLIRLIKERDSNETIYHTVDRLRGSITIDNKLYGRYSGQMSLVKENMTNDSRINVIGYIHPEYVQLLDFIDDSVKIKIVK